jgi:DnaJ family protein A protein 2
MFFGGFGDDFPGMRRGGAKEKVDNERLYKVLGVEKDASEDQIRKVYRKLAMVNHPDRGGDPDKVTMFRHCSELTALFRSSRKFKRPMKFSQTRKSVKSTISTAKRQPLRAAVVAAVQRTFLICLACAAAAEALVAHGKARTLFFL